MSASLPPRRDGNMTAMSRAPASVYRRRRAVAATVVVVLGFLAIKAMTGHGGGTPPSSATPSSRPPSPSATPSPGSTAFPPDIYPPPVSTPSWGLLEGCPSMRGVGIPLPPTEDTLLPIVSKLGHVSEHLDLLSSDQAFWPMVRQTWMTAPASPTPPLVLTSTDVVSGPAATSPVAQLVRQTCGQDTLRRSWWIGVCPPDTTGGCTPAAIKGAGSEDVLFIRRRGLWLVWLTYP